MHVRWYIPQTTGKLRALSKTEFGAALTRSALPATRRFAVKNLTFLTNKTVPDSYTDVKWNLENRVDFYRQDAK